MKRGPIEDGEFYVTSTLLASDPDTNIRRIYCWPDDTPVCVFNAWMRPWTPLDAKRLQVVLAALNSTRRS